MRFSQRDAWYFIFTIILLYWFSNSIEKKRLKFYQQNFKSGIYLPNKLKNINTVEEVI